MEITKAMQWSCGASFQAKLKDGYIYYRRISVSGTDPWKRSWKAGRVVAFAYGADLRKYRTLDDHAWARSPCGTIYRIDANWPLIASQRNICMKVLKQLCLV